MLLKNDNSIYSKYWENYNSLMILGLKFEYVHALPIDMWEKCWMWQTE